MSKKTSSQANNEHLLCFREGLTLTEDLFTNANHEGPIIHHSDLFHQQGERLLLEGDSSGIKYFDMALELDPSNSQLLYMQGLSLFDYGIEKGKEKNLLLASKRFRKATKVNGQFFEAWKAWGEVLLTLGNVFKEHHYFQDAKAKFQKAIQLRAGQSDAIVSELYHSYGQLMYKLAKQSQEVSDLNIALDAYSKGYHLMPYQSLEFWKGFGNVYVTLGNQVIDSRLHLKSIECYRKGLQIDNEDFESWTLLGKSLQNLYSYTHDEDHFSQANECYATAAQINPVDSDLWLAWANMLFESGKRLCDTKRLHSCLEKCHRANVCDKNNPYVISIWSEALSSLGIFHDRLDLLQDAENKIYEILKCDEQKPEVWHAFGMCLLAFGNYYNDVDYYYQAIEKFQEGLSINRAFHKLWFALGVSYAQAAEYEADPNVLKRACKFFSRAIHLCNKSSYYYEYALALSKLGEFKADKAFLESAALNFEQALSLQKNAIYLHPEWLFQYALTLDSLADHTEDSKYYQKAIEILNHVLIVDPEHPEVHYRLALCYAHYGELTDELELYLRAITHFKLSAKKDEENDIIILDWALTLINAALLAQTGQEQEHLFDEAQYKLIQAAKLGNIQSYYHLACLHSIRFNIEESMQFLEKAEKFNALPPMDDLLQDSWLENLRHTEEFMNFISQSESTNLSDFAE